MSPSKRSSTLRRRPASNPDQDEHGPTTTQVPQDPARVAADLLLRRATSAAGIAEGRVGADGTVALVIVPSPVWVEACMRCMAPLASRWRAVD